MHNFGKNLARLRQARGLSQRELAAKLAKTQSHIGDLEAGRVNPSWKLACQMAKFFDVTLDDMTAEPEPAYA